MDVIFHTFQHQFTVCRLSRWIIVFIKDPVRGLAVPDESMSAYLKVIPDSKIKLRYYPGEIKLYMFTVSFQIGKSSRFADDIFRFKVIFVGNTVKFMTDQLLILVVRNCDRINAYTHLEIVCIEFFQGGKIGNNRTVS